MLFASVLLLASAVAALSVQEAIQVPLSPPQVVDHEEADRVQYLVETGPGKIEWISENRKWELRREGINFMDITEHQDFQVNSALATETVTFPSEMKHNDTVVSLLDQLEKQNMRDHLETFTAFHTRYYKSDYGRQSSEWLLKNVKETVADSGALDHGTTVEHFKHSWGQHSVVVKIPGQSENTVVIGAHQDSINLFIPSLLAAPGADDDGSGTVTIWEALRVLLTDEGIVNGEATNTIEFHWYSAEEGGLLGSQDIFKSYQREGRKVKAMLQQDMTGYIHKTIEAGEPESVGVITDYVDEGLTNYIKLVIDEYCDIPAIDTKCGYACSDHASASKAGYPSAFVIESDFKYSDDKIHSTNDKIEYLSFDHMLQHAKMTLGLAYELAFADFD